MHFALLWSFFEAKVLNSNGSAKSIVEVSKRWETDRRLTTEMFSDCLVYFRRRYFQNNDFTNHFADLKFRSRDKQPLVEAVLKGENENVADTVAALLIIVYRLRNNLFHGEKWADELKGQLDNFTHANALLMLALDLSTPWVRRSQNPGCENSLR